LIALAANSPDLAVVAIRPHLIWGPGDTQLVGRIVDRARAGRLSIVGSGAALIDTTYIDNAADALVASLDRARFLGGRALVVTNGQPRPIRELMNRIVIAAGLKPPRIKVPYRMAYMGGLAAERIWELRGSEDDPPMTSFAAEHLGTAHWFDQRETRRALQWEPAVSLAEGFQRLRAWFATQGTGPSR
jgi:nucleoside-diphosphate-sugar epimerase